MATNSYFILLLRKLSPYHILSGTTKSVTIDEEGIPNIIWSYYASLSLLSETNASAMGACVSHQFKYQKGLLGQKYVTYLQICTSDAQLRTAKCITQAPNKVDHHTISDNAKWAKELWKTIVSERLTKPYAMLGKR